MRRPNQFEKRYPEREAAPKPSNPTYLAKTFQGLEEVLAAELAAIGAEDIKILKRAVSFRGDKALLYRSNLCLRTALTVLAPIGNFTVSNEDELYKKASEINWGKYLGSKGSFVVDSVVYSDHFNNTMFVSMKVKDAIADQFKQKFGHRPDVNKDNPDLRVHVHISREMCSISIDSSGENLYKRGYKKSRTQASLSEVLAAGMVLLSGWDKQSNFVDPMCGSGTIPIEAALIANNIPPGIYRNEFGFMRWTDFDPSLWEQVFEEEKNKIIQSKTQVCANDTDPAAYRACLSNLENAGLKGRVKVTAKLLENYVPPEGGGWAVFDPPYGKRMDDGDIMDLYKHIGDCLKQNFTGYKAYLFSANSDALKNIGLKSGKKFALFNGPLECRLAEYDVYEGSREITEE